MKDKGKTTKKKKLRKLTVYVGPGCAWREKARSRKRCGFRFTDEDDLCSVHEGMKCHRCGNPATHQCGTPLIECKEFACDVCMFCCTDHGAAEVEMTSEGVVLASKEPRPGLMSENDTLRLRYGVRMFYDLQAMRIAGNNRGKKKKGEDEGRVVVDLDESDRRFQKKMAAGIEQIEKWALVEVERIGVHHPMWKWLTDNKGVGPTLAGFILAEFDPHRAERPSSFWKFAGLHVEDGRSPHPKKGEKLDYSSRVRSKMLAVLGSCLIKAANEDYRPVYDEAKQSRLDRIVVCMSCEGLGVILSKPRWNATPDDKIKLTLDNAKKLEKFLADGKSPCWNCKGKKNAEWGRGKAHRHAHANRVMVKAFLADLWRAWRIACCLPAVPLYRDRGTGDGNHPHKGRYGKMPDGSDYEGPGYPDEQGYWPAEFGWPRDKRPKKGEFDRFDRKVLVDQK